MDKTDSDIVAADESDTASPGEADLAAAHDDVKQARVEARLAAMPTKPSPLMPTALGNVLRAAEDGVQEKYGLDAVRCWAERHSRRAGRSRTSLNAAGARWFWGTLLIVWVVFTPWAILAAVVASWLTFRAVLAAGVQYASLIDAAYALHRGALYDAPRRPRPSAEEERDAGRGLTEELARGPVLAAPSAQ